MLTASSLESTHRVDTIFLNPLPNFDHKKLKGTWFYEKENPFPSKIPVREATSLLPFVIDETREVIIRDKETNKVVFAVYRNRIGPKALEIMQNTIKEMMQIRRKVARSAEIKKLKQGVMAAAGYIYYFFLYILTNIYINIYIQLFSNERMWCFYPCV